MPKNYGWGISVNLLELAEGVFRLIQQHPDGACLVIGMMPRDIMESVENALKTKVVPDGAVYLGDDPRYGWRMEPAKIRAEIMRDLTCEILKIAERECILMV